MIYKCKECNNVFESNEQKNCPLCESDNLKELTNNLYNYELIPEDLFNHELNKVQEMLNSRLRLKFILAITFLLSLILLAFIANNKLLSMIDTFILMISFVILILCSTKDTVLNRNQEVLRKIKGEAVYIRNVPYKVINYDKKKKSDNYILEFNIGKKLKEKVDERVFTVNGPMGELNLFYDPTTDYCYVMNA
jgi:hypothetical protein